MRTHPDDAHVDGAVIPVIRTRGTVHEVGVRTHSAVTHVIRTLVSVVRAPCAVRLMVILASTRPVTSVRIGTVIGRRIAAGRPGRVVRMGTDALPHMSSVHSFPSSVHAVPSTS